MSRERLRFLVASPVVKLLRLLEFFALFYAAPILYARYFRDTIERGGRPFPMIPLLILVSLAALAVLLTDRSFPRRQLWNPQHFRKHLLPVLGTFLIAGGALALAAAHWKIEGVFYLPGAEQWRAGGFLYLPRQYPVFWAILMVLYPLLSVYPQELVYRAFLFHRYRVVFPTPWVMVFASAASFGFMHVVFWNWVAVALSFLGGLLFAATYRRTRSLLMSGIEHALYGDLIFTVGLGLYFFHGILEFARRVTGVAP